jgi:3-deoxy-manno-octulosonate cytidylyltransferase (CMP-KDO synthetase)
MELHGMTVLERVYRQAVQAKPKSVIIATDNEEIFKLATNFGAQVEMTNIAHQSGTDRIAEVVALRQFSPEEIIVNVQGDEPLIAPALITQVANSLASADAPMATLCWPVEDHEMCTNTNVVKVVRNCHNNALYFSRNTIPFSRDNSESIKNIFRHIGLYAYRAAFLLEYVNWPVCDLEAIEALEQLRVLWAGYNIKVEEACVYPLQDINTIKDLEKARCQLAG